MVVATKLRNEPFADWNHLLVSDRNLFGYWLVLLGDGRDLGVALLSFRAVGTGSLLLMFRKARARPRAHLH
jgi:hypothetical protein